MGNVSLGSEVHELVQRVMELVQRVMELVRGFWYILSSFRGSFGLKVFKVWGMWVMVI